MNPKRVGKAMERGGVFALDCRDRLCDLWSTAGFARPVRPCADPCRDRRYQRLFHHFPPL